MILKLLIRDSYGTEIGSTEIPVDPTKRIWINLKINEIDYAIAQGLKDIGHLDSFKGVEFCATLFEAPSTKK